MKYIGLAEADGDVISFAGEDDDGTRSKSQVAA